MSISKMYVYESFIVHDSSLLSSLLPVPQKLRLPSMSSHSPYAKKLSIRDL